MSNVEHPKHYQYEGVEVWDIVREMNFNLGNAVKYIARAGLKDKSREIEDLQKAIFYIRDEQKHGVFPEEPESLEDAWGEKVYRLGGQLNTNRQEALEWACIGGSPTNLQYAINFLEREIEDLS